MAGARERQGGQYTHGAKALGSDLRAILAEGAGGQLWRHFGLAVLVCCSGIECE